MMVPQWQMDAARKAYEGYAKYTDWKSAVTGDNLPQWDNLPAQIKNAWHSAVMNVFRYVNLKVEGEE